MKFWPDRRLVLWWLGGGGWPCTWLRLRLRLRWRLRMFCENVSTTNEIVCDWRGKVLSVFIPKINSKVGKDFSQKCTKR